jgi:hypothetical protein
MFGKPRYNKEKGVALCYSSQVVVTKNYREFRLNYFTSARNFYYH